jgi:hypothetical protein
VEDEIIFKILGNIGVPAAVCFYTLYEVNKNVKRLAESIDRFANEVDRRIEKLEDDLHELTVEVKTWGKRSDQHDNP